METKIEVTCPYCGYKNTITRAIHAHNKRDIILCDIEEGGCDKYFVYRPMVKIHADVWKIEEK